MTIIVKLAQIILFEYLEFYGTINKQISGTESNGNIPCSVIRQNKSEPTMRKISLGHIQTVKIQISQRDNGI